MLEPTLEELRDLANILESTCEQAERRIYYKNYFYIIDSIIKAEGITPKIINFRINRLKLR